MLRLARERIGAQMSIPSATAYIGLMVCLSWDELHVPHAQAIIDLFYLGGASAAGAPDIDKTIIKEYLKKGDYLHVVIPREYIWRHS